MIKERLIEAGQMLFGDDWKSDVARALGPYHHRGPREQIDLRLVRRWASGERPIPEWVEPALADLLTRKVADLPNLNRRINEWLSAAP